MSRRSRKHLVFFTIGSIALLGACKPQTEVAPVTNQTPEEQVGGGDAGVVVDTEGMVVTLPAGANKVEYALHKASGILDPCTAVEGEDAVCFLEGDELDLFHQGLTFRYNVPRELCAYVLFEQYYYYDKKVDTGASSIIYDIDKNGNIGRDTRGMGPTSVVNVGDGVITCTGIDNNSDGDFTDPGKDNNGDGDFDDPGMDYNKDGDYTDPGSPCIDSNGDGDCADPGDIPEVPADILPDVQPDNPPDVPCQAQVDGANASLSTKVVWSGSDFQCLTDYSNFYEGGPNCCLGSAAMIVGNWDGSKYSYSVSNKRWNGSAGNCLVGPGMDNTTARTKSGFPKFPMYFVEESGLNEDYKIVGSLDKAAGNAYIANYNAAVLAAPANPAAWPVAFHSASGIYPDSQPYFAWTCYDHAAEVSARIRLHVREWNEQEKLENALAGVCTIGQASCNPESTGNEPDFDTPSLNDVRDWGDIGNAFPNEIL